MKPTWLHLLECILAAGSSTSFGPVGVLAADWDHVSKILHHYLGRREWSRHCNKINCSLTFEDVFWEYYHLAVWAQTLKIYHAPLKIHHCPTEDSPLPHRRFTTAPLKIHHAGRARWGRAATMDMSTSDERLDPTDSSLLVHASNGNKQLVGLFSDQLWSQGVGQSLHRDTSHIPRHPFSTLHSRGK